MTVREEGEDLSPEMRKLEQDFRAGTAWKYKGSYHRRAEPFFDWLSAHGVTSSREVDMWSARQFYMETACDRSTLGAARAVVKWLEGLREIGDDI